MKLSIRNLFVFSVLFGLLAVPVAAFALTNQEGTSTASAQRNPESEPDEFDEFEDDREDEGDRAELLEEIRESEAEHLRLSRRLQFVAQRVRLLKKMQRLSKRVEAAEVEERQAEEESELQITEARLSILTQRMEALDLLDELRDSSDFPAGLREATRDALRQLRGAAKFVDAMTTRTSDEEAEVEEAERMLLRSGAMIERARMRLELHHARQEGAEEAIAELENGLANWSTEDGISEEDFDE